jgi:hypothetical protein
VPIWIGTVAGCCRHWQSQWHPFAHGDRSSIGPFFRLSTTCWMSEFCGLAHLFELSKNCTLFPENGLLAVGSDRSVSSPPVDRQFERRKAHARWGLRNGVLIRPAASPNSERNLRKRFLVDPSGTLSLDAGQSETIFCRELALNWRTSKRGPYSRLKLYISSVLSQGVF